MTVPAQPGLEGVVTTQTLPGTPNPVPSPAAFAHGANGERTFTAEDIAAARKQEKDKLYSEITSLKEQQAAAQKLLESLQAQRDAEAAELQRKEQEKESKAKARKEEEMSAKALLEQKLQETNNTWESRFNALQAEREQERAIADRERQYNELVSYRNGRLAELSEEIAPEFHDFINGDNREQIDAAIERAKASTQSIWNQVQQATQQAQQTPRGVSPTGYASFGPLDGALGEKTTYTAADINNMSMQQYQEFRQKAGIASGEAFRNRGLFG